MYMQANIKMCKQLCYDLRNKSLKNIFVLNSALFKVEKGKDPLVFRGSPLLTITRNTNVSQFSRKLKTTRTQTLGMKPKSLQQYLRKPE